MAETNTNEIQEEEVSRSYIYKTFGIKRDIDIDNNNIPLFQVTGVHRIGCYVNLGDLYGAYIELSDREFTLENDYSTYNIRGANFALELYRTVIESDNIKNYQYYLKVISPDSAKNIETADLRFQLIYGVPDFSTFTITTPNNSKLVGKNYQDNNIYSDVMPGKLWAKEGIDGSIIGTDFTINIYTGDKQIDETMQFVKSVKAIVESMVYDGTYYTE